MPLAGYWPPDQWEDHPFVQSDLPQMADAFGGALAYNWCTRAAGGRCLPVRVLDAEGEKDWAFLG